MTRLHRKHERLHAPAEGIPPAPTEHERRMAEFSIDYDGLRYHYNGYRYDTLADVVAYAMLMRSRPGHVDAGGPYAKGQTFFPPTEAERTFMDSMAIRFDGRAYRFEEFRYDRLEDAVNYAKRPSA